MKNKFLIILCTLCFAARSQGKWDKDLAVDYKMTDKDEALLNHIEIKKDTIFYEWIEKNKHNTKKMVIDTTIENKLLKAINDHKILKHKTGKLTKGSVNMVLKYNSGKKSKTVIFPQPVKQGSNDEKFMQQFLEPILTKLFEQELKNFPK
jgi:hypothetical protein